MSHAPQTIFPIRREYNAWVADETLEDYALRYTPRAARKWSEWRVASTAFGGTSFLALEAIGAAVALNYGFTNALWAIVVMGAVIFLTALPISVCAARYGLDMDLLTRGAGFGYLGSTLTSLIYASFTFIFFAVEAAIMALALQLAFDWPLMACYLLSALIVIPMVLWGITFISRLQAWTQPVWALLLLAPFLWFAVRQPELYTGVTLLSGLSSGHADFDWLSFGAAATVISALLVQVGEQVDYLRFMPAKTAANRGRWWGAVLLGGPGWILMGAPRMLGGAFLAYVALQYGASLKQAADPTQMYLAAYLRMLGDYPAALACMVLFVVLSQVKINVTNAYAGSLAWSNVFARLTRNHPGRVVWLVFNVGIATLLMMLGVYGALEKVLGIYSNVAVAWVGALVADLVINKPLGLSPPGTEFRRAHLYDLNPVGLGAMLAAAALGGAAYTGLLGDWAAAFCPFIVLATAMLLSPLIARATRGRWYIARAPAPLARGELVCVVCQNRFERADMTSCPAYSAPICSLCCSLDSRCHDRCKPPDARAEAQVWQTIAFALPRPVSRRINFAVAQYIGVVLLIAATLAAVLGIVYVQEGLHADAQALREPFLKAFSLLMALGALCAWWVVLASGSRRMAQEESERQTQLLQKEIDAHSRTDMALQTAKEQAEAASQAKTRYVAGMAHELRTPLTSILGYAQLLLRRGELSAEVRESIATVHQSGQHMHALIDGVLDLARIEAGRLRLDLAPLHFPTFLDQLARMVRPQADAKRLTFQVERVGRLPAWVRADAKRLRQILINLLGNAVRFTDAGHVVLRVEGRGDVLRFDVEDTGIGIDAQDQERIFMPFERGSAGRRTASAGTGLGLAITQMLALLMGGELSVRSARGHGSTFSVRLYLPEIAPPARSTALAAPPDQSITGYEGRRRRLLVVDDEPVHRQLLAGLLIPLGFSVHEAASGSECIEALDHALPDAILLDLTMDDLSGWQTAALIRTRFGASELPIVIVSADLFENQGEQVEQAGCQGFVGKPVIESQLLRVLGSALGLQWLREREPPPAHEGQAPAPADLTQLPAALRRQLQRLSRQGNGSGLRKLLRGVAEEQPRLAPAMQALSVYVNQFDFKGLTQALTDDSLDNDDDDA
ncbi:MAG: ATP-binding protein [Ottowia sp.]|uniref:hybrid sensor histidine kinase/response regulator n=1 Tax=Ottowia sp. TaxID=1898956 RepID=UPI0039E3A05F